MIKFVVFEHNYDETCVHGVFSSEAMAEEYIKQYCFDSPDRVSFGILGKEKNECNFKVLTFITDIPQYIPYGVD